MHFYLPGFLDVYNLAEISALVGLVVYLHSSDNNFERSISVSDPISMCHYLTIFRDQLLLRRNPDFEVN